MPVPGPPEIIPLTVVLDHAKLVPVVALVATYVNELPVQIPVGASVLLNTGVGYTVMENCTAAPAQLFDIGVTVKSDVIVAVVALVAVNALIVPLPEDARPIELNVFDHA